MIKEQETKYVDESLLVFKDIPISLDELNLYEAIDGELDFIFHGYKKNINSTLRNLREIANLQSNEYIANDVENIELFCADIKLILHDFKRITNIRAILNADNTGA